MEIIARKSNRLLIAAVTLFVFGGAALLYAALIFALKPEGVSQSDGVIFTAFGAAMLLAGAASLITHIRQPKIIAACENGVFSFCGFECESTDIMDADYKQKRDKTGTLIIYTKEGARALKNVADVEFAYDKLAILILKGEGYLND